MNLDWKNCLKKVKSINYSAYYFGFLGKKSRWLIFLVLIFVVGLCGHVWYAYIYNPDWSEEQKKNYMNSKEKGTIFNEAKFQEIVSEQEKRKENYNKNEENIKDIFRLGEREVK